jgi:hypothetical protein
VKAIVEVLVGAAMLLLGRELYWLFVGGTGFVLGTGLVARFLQGQAIWLTIVIAFTVGLLGALLALFVQKLAIAVAGFASGGYVVASLVSVLGMEARWVYWLASLLGGLLGALFVSTVFDWALLVLSSLAGAALIVQAVQLGPVPAILLFLVLTGLGIVVQARLMWREKRRRPKR